MTQHGLKVWPNYFRAIEEGRKRFEIRYNDRHYRVGDKLILYEWDPGTRQATGCYISAKVSYITEATGLDLLRPGVIVMQLEDVACPCFTDATRLSATGLD